MDRFPTITLGTGIRPDSEVYSIVRRAVELGYRAFDTAAAYGTEFAIGQALQHSGIDRNRFHITIKLRGSVQTGLVHIRKAVSQTIKTLGIEYADLVLPHWPLPMVGNTEAVFGHLLTLRSTGLVRQVGLSNATAAIVRSVRAYSGEWPSVNQVHLSPLVTQADLRRAVAGTPVLIQAYRIFEAETKLMHHSKVLEMAEKYGCSPATLLVNWQLSQGHVVLIGASSSGNLRENLYSERVQLGVSDIHALRMFDLHDRFRPNPYHEFQL